MGNFQVTLHQPGVTNPSTGKEITYTLYEVGSDNNDYLLNATLKLEVNKAGTFEFDILPSHSYYSVLRRYIHYICVKELATGIERDEAIPIDLDPGSIETLPIEDLGDTQILFYGRILTMSLSFNGTKHVVCEGLMANLLDCPMYVSGAYDSGVTADKIFTVRGTPESMFISAINAYRNLIRTDIYTGIIHSEANAYSFDDLDVSGGTSVGDFITSELVEAHGGFLDMEYKQFTNGSIVGFLHWAPDPSMSSYNISAIDQTIEFGVNLLDINAENSEDEICTGIIPTWEDADNEKKWATTRSRDVDSNEKNIFKPYVVGADSGVAAAGIKIVDIPCTKTQEQALSYANTYVSKYCDYELSTIDFDSYTVRAIDMHYVDQVSKHKIGLYNRVKIKCLPHSIDKVLLCTSIEITLDNAENSSYTFSVYRPKASNNEKTLTRQLNGRPSWNKVQSDVARINSRTNEQAQAGYITQETDPTVPAWAKASSKPSYTAQEVGALPSSTKIPEKTSDLANDGNGTSKFATVSQLPTKLSDLSNDGDGTYDFATTDIIPTKTSDLTNDGDGTSKFATVSQLPQIPTKTSDLTNDGDGTSEFVRIIDLPPTDNYVILKGPSQVETNVEKMIEDQFIEVCSRFDTYSKETTIVPVYITGSFLQCYEQNYTSANGVFGVMRIIDYRRRGGTVQFNISCVTADNVGPYGGEKMLKFVCGLIETPYDGIFSSTLYTTTLLPIENNPV